MTARKRPAKKKPAAKRTVQQNSNIQLAQKATTDARKTRADQTAKKAEQGKQAPPSAPAVDPKLAAAQAATDPRNTLSKNTLEQHLKPGQSIAGKGNTNDATAAFKAAVPAANKIAGLASGLMETHQASTRALADASLWGNNSDKNRAAKLTALMSAQDKTRVAQLTKTGNAVYMGPKVANAKVRTRGPERVGEDGSDTTTIGPVGDNIVTKDELMSWLADEANFNKIKAAANKAGIDVATYDDVSKLWSSVVNQAAATYSTTGKKVTPWALLQLRGKTMVGGKPASKTTTSTSIDEMDPAVAKGMIRTAASQMLGRDPTKAEMEDFIAKAQTIAKANPNITTTTTNYGFDGNPTDQSSVSKGGGDAVTAQAQEAAMAQAKQSEDYTSYQGAGVIFPWLAEAIASPV